MKENLMSALVLDASGQAGKPLFEQLKNQPGQWLAGIDLPGRGRYLQRSVVVDHGDPLALSHAMRGMRTVVIPHLDRPDARACHTAILQACHDAGVKQVIRESVIGADAESDNQWLRLNGWADHQLMNSGLAVSIFRCAPYFQSLSLTAVSKESSGYRLILALGDSHSYWLDHQDLAAAVYEQAQQPRSGATIFRLTGRQPLSGDQLAQVFSEVSKRSVFYVDAPDSALRARMNADGVPKWQQVQYLDQLQAVRQGEGELPYSDIYRLLLRPPTTADVCLRRLYATGKVMTSGVAT